MNRPSLQRIRDLLLVASDLAPGERGRFLQDACGGDAALRAEVEALLAHDVEGATFVDLAAVPEMPEAAEPPEPELAPEAEIDGLRIVRMLGRGGMARVYEAIDPRDGAAVAVKVLAAGWADEPDLRRRFERELAAATRLEHPHIARYRRIGEHEGRLYLVLDLVAGGSLQDRLDRLAEGERLPLFDSLRIARQVAAGLAAAHAAGVLHRDVKPGNVLFDQSGNVRLIDFGVAKLLGATTLTRSRCALGTVANMAPEQLRGEEVDARADLFALGVLLQTMLTGREPFGGGTLAETVHRIVDEDPPRLADAFDGVPPGLQELLDGMLAKNPGRRLADAGEVARRLRELEASAPPEMAPASGRPPASRRRRSIVVAIVVAVALAVGFVGREAQPPDPVPAPTRIWRIQPSDAAAGEGIQAALDRAAPGDTLLLGDGLYRGPGNRNLNPAGKALVVRSASDRPENCVIDVGAPASGDARGFWFVSGEDSTTVLRGVSVRGGRAARGGALRIRAGSPRIENCVFEANSADEGGAIAILAGAEPRFLSCAFRNNRAGRDGGAIVVSESGGRFDGCAFVGNRAEAAGGALVSSNGAARFVDCLFEGNEARSGAALACAFFGDRTRLDHCTLAGEVAAREGAEPTLSCCRQPGTPADAACDSQGVRPDRFTIAPAAATLKRGS